MSTAVGCTVLVTMQSAQHYYSYLTWNLPQVIFISTGRRTGLDWYDVDYGGFFPNSQGGSSATYPVLRYSSVSVYWFGEAPGRLQVDVFHCQHERRHLVRSGQDFSMPGLSTPLDLMPNGPARFAFPSLGKRTA